MVFGPAARLTGPEAVPEVTGVPLTETVILACATVGVTVMLVVALRTVAV